MTETKELIENYDPNEARSLQNDIELELVFQQWEYRYAATVKAGGNVTELDSLIDQAVTQLVDGAHEWTDDESTHHGLEWRTHEGIGYVVIRLRKEGGDVLEVDNFDGPSDDEDLLKRMLVSARIVGVVPR